MCYVTGLHAHNYVIKDCKKRGGHLYQTLYIMYVCIHTHTHTKEQPGEGDFAEF